MVDDNDIDDDDIDSDDDDGNLVEPETASDKLASMKQKWRDIEIKRELLILERELGEKIDSHIFD